MSEIRILNLCHKESILVDIYRQSLLSIYVSSSQQGHPRIKIIKIIHRGVSVSTCLTVSYHVGNELEHLIHFVSDHTILQDVFPDNAAKRKI